MANTYPIVRPDWLDSLPHLFSISEDNAAKSALRLFGLFLSLKIAMPFAFVDGIHWSLNARTVAIFSLLVVAALPRFYHSALWVILGLSFYESWRSWPFTINHGGLEFGILLLMCLIPKDDSKSFGISCADMIKLLMLSVWFYSGVHKLLDGYYLNAEFFALEVLSNETTLGQHLHYILGFFGFGTNAEALACCTEGVFEFSKGQIGILLALSWLTIIVEIVLPLSLLSPKLRPLGIVSLFIFQSFVSYFSGEIDFAFTAFAVLFLFVPRLAPFTYPSLACVFLVVQPWI